MDDPDIFDMYVPVTEMPPWLYSVMGRDCWAEDGTYGIVQSVKDNGMGTIRVRIRQYPNAAKRVFANG